MGEKCLNSSKRRKIEDTVLQILKASDMETITECSVRSAAAVRLGFELSGLNHRLLVRQLVDSFLLSTAAEIVRTDSLNRINDANSTDKSVDYHVEQRRQQQHRRDIGSVLEENYDGKIICKLSNKRSVTVHDFVGATMVSIREFYVQDGNLLPVKGTNSGISLTSAQWSSFRNSIPFIEEAIVRLESRLRSGAVIKQSEADVASSVADSASEKSQTEPGVSNLASVIHPSRKRKQNESEPDMRSSAADPATENSQTQATISNLVSIVHSHIKSEQPEADTSNAETASISQEHILAGKAQAPGTYGTTASSSYQEQIPASRTEAQSENATLVPPLPNQLDRVTALSPGEQIPAQSKQTDIGISTSVPSFPSQGHSHHTANAIPPEQLIPIQPARFDGRNYHSWRNQMEMFLNQLNIAYVLSERCPSISLNREASFEAKVGAETAMQRWITDDYLCRHNILNSLCDSLFQLYSQKSFSARDLWEELKVVYNDDFGTKRSQINKYIHFQMVDGVSILDQVQELHVLADSIIASGTWIKETFHVSVIISKLPPSWKELRLKLMQEEFLPVNMLMHRLRVEAESRDLYKKTANSKKDHVTEPKLDQRQRTKRDEYKRACFTCGKEGHISKNCRDRKFERCDTSNGKESGFLSPCTGTKMDDADKKACFTCGKDGHISKSCPDRKFEPCDKSNSKENEVLSPVTNSEMDDTEKPK